MISVSEEAKNVWSDIVSDKAVNWMGCGYVASSKQDLELVGSGTGGLEEAVQLCAKDILYIGVRVYGTKMDGSEKRTKFVALTYVPPEVTGLKKARVSMHKGAVMKTLFKFIHVQMEANSRNQLANSEVQARLNNACGSHKPEMWNFGSTLGSQVEEEEKQVEEEVEEKVVEEHQQIEKTEEDAPVEEESPSDY